MSLSMSAAIGGALTMRMTIMIGLMTTSICSPSFVVNAQAPDFEVSGDRESPKSYSGGCFPDIDPKTGYPYPVCPSSIRPTQVISKSDEKVVIDASADAYKRIVDSQKKSGELTQDEWLIARQRVKEARQHARGEVEKTLDRSSGINK